jgi:hypothetical protein
VGLVSDEGLRGTIATRDFSTGEVVAMLRPNCTVPLGPHTLSAPVQITLDSNIGLLLDGMHADPLP